MKVGKTLSMIEDGEVLGCGGVIPRWKGCGEVWIAVTEKLRNRPVLLVRSTKRVIQMLHEAGFHRLDMHIAKDDAGLCRWAISLGFTFEGIMLMYGLDRKDHNLYSLTWP